MKIDKFKLNEEGLNHFFGPLEAKVMEIVWDTTKITIKDVQQIISQETPLNFNTVMTVMNRLVEKGHLKKQVAGRSYVYYATQTKEEFLQEQTKGMTQQLIKEFGELVVSHMVEAIDEVDPQLLQELENKINALKEKK